MSRLGFSKCMAYLEWSKQNNKGSGYQVQRLSAEESKDNKTDSRVQTCSTNMFNKHVQHVHVVAWSYLHGEGVSRTTGSRPQEKKIPLFKQETFTTANDAQQWKRSTSSLMLKDHLVGMPRVRSRCLLEFLSDLGFHAQYTLIGCITDKGNIRANPKYLCCREQEMSLSGQCLGRYAPTQLLCFTLSLKSIPPGMLIPVWAYSYRTYAN